MDQKFAALVESLAPKLSLLLDSPASSGGQLPAVMPRSGVYLFTENGKHLYVGRSNNIRRRYALHTLPGSQHNQASFAYRLARNSLQLLTSRPSIGRAAFAALPEFKAAFNREKARIRMMQFRWVEQENQNYQAVLEIYAAVALDTPYNDFKTH